MDTPGEKGGDGGCWWCAALCVSAGGAEHHGTIAMQGLECLLGISVEGNSFIHIFFFVIKVFKDGGKYNKLFLVARIPKTKNAHHRDVTSRRQASFKGHTAWCET
jgi:hypothetical protein